MYKVQVVLVPPSVRDNFVPVGFTSTLEDSSQLMTNGANQTNLPNGLENSIQNWNSTNNSMMLSSYFTQPRLKRFLMFTNPSNTLLDLADEILAKCEKMYPNVANDIEILSLQDSNSCDLDPDFVVKDVFNMDNTVRVILKDEINLDAEAARPVSLYGNSKRRKLNNGEQQQTAATQPPVPQTQNTGTLKIAKKRNSTAATRSTTNPNLRISTPLANQIYPSQTSNNSDDEDDIAERSFLPPPAQPQSPPIRISSGIETSKRIKYSGVEDTVSRSETVDPDKSRQQRMLSGTPLRTDMTPNRVTLTGQRVVSESYDGTPRSNGLIFTNTTTQSGANRRGSMNNARITSGMLTIPEPKIAEVEEELKEGPSSPASMLPPKADRIPMKKPYMEHPVVSGDDSSSSSDSYDTPQNEGEKSPSIRKQDSSHNEALEQSPVKSSPFNRVPSQNSSERRKSSNLQSSFTKPSRDSQRLSSLEAKIENKSLSKRSIRRINNFSEDEIEDQQDQIHVAKLPPKSKELEAAKANNTFDLPENADMNNVADDTSVDIENEANNTVRYTDIQSELHNKSHEPLNKEDLLNILDKPQAVKTGKKLIDETKNLILEKPTEEKESSVDSVIETKLAPTPPVQARKRDAADTVKELMKTSKDLPTRKAKSSAKVTKKETATQTKKQPVKKAIPAKKATPSKPKSTKTVELKGKDPEEKEKPVSPPKRGNVNLFEKFVADTNVKRTHISSYDTVNLKRTDEDDSNYSNTSDSEDDIEQKKTNSIERNLQINDIMSLQDRTAKKTTKPTAPQLSKKSEEVMKTEKLASTDSTSSSGASATEEENDSESERKPTLTKIRGGINPPEIKVNDTLSGKIAEMDNRKVNIVGGAKPATTKKRKVFQSPEFISSSEDDESTDDEQVPSQENQESKPQSTPSINKESETALQTTMVESKNLPELKKPIIDRQKAVDSEKAKTSKLDDDESEYYSTSDDSGKEFEDKTKTSPKKTIPSQTVVDKSVSNTTKLADKKTEVTAAKSEVPTAKSSNITNVKEGDKKTNVENTKPAVKKITKSEPKSIKKDDVEDPKPNSKKSAVNEKNVEPKSASPTASITKVNQTKKTEAKPAVSKLSAKTEPTKPILKQESSTHTSKSSSEESSSCTSGESSSSSGSDESSGSGSDDKSSSSESDSDSDSSSSDESSSDEESSSTRTSRRVIVAPPKGSLSDTKLSSTKESKPNTEDKSTIDDAPQSTQQASKPATKATKQPSMNRPPLKSASKETTPVSSQTTESTLPNISSQPPKLEDSTSSTNTSTNNVSPISKLPRKYRPSLSSLSDLVSRGIPDVKEKNGKASAPSLAKRGKEIKRDESSSESSSSESESSDDDGDSGSSDSSSDSDSDSSSDSDSDSDSSSSEEETYISAKSANAALNKKKKKTNGGGGFASLIKDSKKHK